MGLLSNIDSSSPNGLMPWLGSFWTSRFAQKTQPKLIVALATQSNLLGSFRSAALNMAGDDKQAKLEKFVTLNFDPKLIVVTGSLLYSEPFVTTIEDTTQNVDLGSLTNTKTFNDYGTITDTPNDLENYGSVTESSISSVSAEGEQAKYAPDTNVNLVYGTHAIKYYGIRVTTHIPRVVQARFRRLLLGVDFFCVNDQWIYFRQDPRVLFPDSRILMPLAERVNYKSLTSFLIRAAVPDNGAYVLRYMRQQQTPGAFCLALAAVAGLKITHFRQKLLYIRQQVTSTIYTFERENIRVDYPHTLLEVGQIYEPDMIIGGGVKVFFGTNNNVAWWRQVDWDVGISLDPILKNFKGLALLDRETTAYVANSDAGSVRGSKAHVRIKLSDNFESENPYWSWVADRETNSGQYVNQLLNLEDAVDGGDPSVSDTFAKLIAQYQAANLFNAEFNLPLESPDVSTLPGTLRVNALDFFFEAVLRKQGLVIVIDQSQIQNPGALYSFMQREMLSGVIPIVLTIAPSLGVESAAVGVTMDVDDTLVMTPTTPLVLGEQIELSNIVDDRVQFDNQTPIYD